MTKATIPQTRYLTVTEVSQHLRVSRMTVYRMLALGSIPHIRTGVRGRTYRIPASYLTALDSRRPETPRIPGQTEITA